MKQHPAYSWDFDRPTDEYLASFDSFSVAIFQWLPRTNGKDLKKSKAVARVIGYPAEPERVYRMALRICSRLNREGVKFGTTPDWLQKQYSIRRPADMIVVHDPSDRLTARLRSYRAAVMKRLLLPAGFVVGKEGTYLRRSGEQIHLIRFDTRQSVPHVYLTLGFHYSYVPTQQVAHIPLQRLHFLDCIIHTEASRLLATTRSDRFCSELRQDMLQDLEKSARQALSVLDKYAVRWRDAADFLIDATGHKMWMPRSKPNPVALACVALRCGKPELVETLLGQINESERSAGWLRLKIEWLGELLSEHRQAMNAGLELPRIPDWYSDNSD